MQTELPQVRDKAAATTARGSRDGRGRSPHPHSGQSDTVGAARKLPATVSRRPPGSCRKRRKLRTRDPASEPPRRYANDAALLTYQASASDPGRGTGHLGLSLALLLCCHGCAWRKADRVVCPVRRKPDARLTGTCSSAGRGLGASALRPASPRPSSGSKLTSAAVRRPAPPPLPVASIDRLEVIRRRRRGGRFGQRRRRPRLRHSWRRAILSILLALPELERQLTSRRQRVSNLPGLCCELREWMSPSFASPVQRSDICTGSGIVWVLNGGDAVVADAAASSPCSR